MANITNKVVTVPVLSHFKEKTDEAYVAQVEGSQLVETTDVQKLKGLENIKEVQVNGKKLTVGEDGIVNIDVEGVITGDGLVSDTELSEQLGEYTKTSDLANDSAGRTYATKTEMGNLGTIIGECTTEELESKKEETGKGDCWVTTDNNHIHYYNGETFIDLGGDIDISNKVDKEQGKSLVSDTDIAQITTNKTDIETINETLSGLQEATNEDIDALFA